jgi:hypothetical protein
MFRVSERTMREYVKRANTPIIWNIALPARVVVSSRPGRAVPFALELLPVQIGSYRRYPRNGAWGEL